MAYWSKIDPDKTYHTCKNCTEGNNIEQRNLQQGDALYGWKECEKCKDLKRQNNCQSGVPTPAR